MKWSNMDWMINNHSAVGPRVIIAGGKLKGKTKPREDTGKLPGHVPEPTFVADPNHRRKLLMKELIAITKLGVDKKCDISMTDCMCTH
jgi:hypothetical protein